MELACLVRLGEDTAQTEVKSICFNGKGEGWLEVSQDRRGGECLLECVEGCLRFTRLLKLEPLAGQRGKGAGHCRVASDELAVEVSKAQEGLHFLD